MLMWESEEEQVFQNYSSVVAWASRSPFILPCSVREGFGGSGRYASRMLSRYSGVMVWALPLKSFLGSS